MSDILDSIDDLLDDDSDDLALSGEILDDDASFDLDEIEKPELSENDAKEITEAIKSAATATYILLAQAHEGKAYKALGYSTWADYIAEEFSLSTSRSYQLLDLSKAVQMIESAAPEGTVVKLTEAQARGIKKELPKITEHIAEATEGKSPQEASEMIDEIIEEAREQKKADDKVLKEKKDQTDQAEEDGYRAGLEAAADAFLDENSDLEDRDNKPEAPVGGSGSNISAQDSMNIYNFLSVLTGVTSLPEPDELIRIIPEERKDEVGNQLDEAVKWFNNFKEVWDINS